MPSILKDWGQLMEGLPMVNQSLASSASLHLRLGAFGVLFGTLVVFFAPPVAFCLTVLTTIDLLVKSVTA